MKIVRAGILGTAALLLVLPQTALGQSDEEVAKRIQAGVKFLRSIQRQNGSWAYGGPQGSTTGGPSDLEVGCTALVTLTLLECGESDQDPAIKSAISFVRAGVVRTNHTYSLACSLWLMDKLNEQTLIQSIAMRLVKGQTANGSWSYFSGQGASTAGAGGLGLGLGVGGGAVEEDNSNAQFAVLALYIARRQGPGLQKIVDPALLKAEKHFRATQVKGEGSWGYNQFVANGSPSMTCAGLLGLAIGYGLRTKETRLTQVAKVDKSSVPAGKTMLKTDELNQDKAIVAALDYLSQHIMTGFQPTDLYFLWSVERVAKVYDLDFIGGKDWYSWGKQALCQHQLQTGGWTGEYSAPVDTSLALLFLKKVNLVKDLTAALGGDRLTQVRDPKTPAKPATGGGGDAKPAAGAPAKPDTTPAAGETEVARLVAELPNAKPVRQQEILDILQDSKGGVYTEAIVDLLPKLSGKIRDRAREALANRLQRMTAKTLREYLKSDNPELRRGAALAVGMKDAKDMIPDLRGLLKDSDAEVQAAALQALKKLGN